MNLDNALDALGNIVLWIGIGYLVGWWVWRFWHAGEAVNFFNHLEAGMIGACLGSVSWHVMQLNHNQFVQYGITSTLWLLDLLMLHVADPFARTYSLPNLLWLVHWFFIGLATALGAFSMTLIGRLLGWYIHTGDIQVSEEPVLVDSYYPPYEPDENRVAAIANRRRQTLRSLDVYITNEVFPYSEQNTTRTHTSCNLAPQPANRLPLANNDAPTLSSPTQRHGVETFTGIAPSTPTAQIADIIEQTSPSTRPVADEQKHAMLPLAYPNQFEEVVFIGSSTAREPSTTMRFNKPIDHIYSN